MSETARGLVLLLSVLLWLPVLPPLLAGQVTTTGAALRYAGTLLLVCGGATALSALLRNYAEKNTAPAPGVGQVDAAREPT